MVIFFSSNRLAKTCNQDSLMLREFGKQWAKTIKLRLVQLAGAPTLADLELLPYGRPHPLAGKRKDRWSMRITGNYRLVFTPLHDPIPLLPDGGLNRAAVTDILILAIEDYHGS